MYPQPRYFRDAKEISVNDRSHISLQCFNDVYEIINDYKIMYNGTMKQGVLYVECFFFMDSIVNNKFYEYINEKNDLSTFGEVYNSNNHSIWFRWNRIVELITIAIGEGLLERLVPNGVYYLFYREFDECYTLGVEKTYLIRE